MKDDKELAKCPCEKEESINKAAQQCPCKAQPTQSECHCHDTKVKEEAKATAGCCHADKETHGSECHCHDTEAKEEAKVTAGCCHAEKKTHGSECHCHEAEVKEEAKATAGCCHADKETHGGECHCHEEANHKEACCCGGEHSVKRGPKPIVSPCCGGEKAPSRGPKAIASPCGCCGEEEAEAPASAIKRDTTVLIIALVALLAAFAINTFSEIKWLHIFSPSYIALVLCGKPLVTSAIKALRRKTINSALLISTAMVASLVLEALYLAGVAEEGHYAFAAAEIAFLMFLGEIIEEKTIEKSQSGITKLFELTPSKCNLWTDGAFVETNIENVRVGDLVLVKADDLISVDGVIEKGETSVDQSTITGESLPIDKGVGDKVFCGTKNKQGAIEIRVSKAQNETTVSKLLSLIEEAEGKKAPIAKLADKWSKYIVPSAVALSVLVFLGTLLLGDLPAVSALVRGVTILVVFCPCALALATPTAVAAGIGNAAGKGILIKSGEALERLAGIDTIAFDKTGTLTTGVISVADCKTEMEEELLKAYLLTLEELSQHPIAAALCAYAAGAERLESDSSVAIGGVGISAKVYLQGGSISASVVSYGYADTHYKTEEEFRTFAEERMALGNTVVCLCLDGTISAAIALSDTLKTRSASAVAQLKEDGYHTVMLTGDNRSAALAVADKLMVDECRYALLPDEKVSNIQLMQEEGKKVCMVGDGVNDAPSLAMASTSIAMGEFGSEAAIDAADVTVLSDDIGKIPGLLSFSKKVLRTIKINIIISMTINLFAVIASTMGWLTPVTGAIVHNISSVLVVSNSALLLKK